MKLMAPRGYYKLPRRLRKKLSNGCGPTGWKAWVVPDHLLGLSIKEACDIHDFGFCVGRTENNRKVADYVFRNNMFKLIERGCKWNSIRTIRYKMAGIYYEAVRDMGYKYFHTPSKHRNCFGKLTVKEKLLLNGILKNA